MTCNLPKWYRYCVVLAASLSQIVTLGYICGTMLYMSVIYEKKFSERKVSGTIGAVQLSVTFLAAVPVVFIVRKLNEGWMQIIGGCLMALGILESAYASKSWQSFLGVSVLSGIGSAASTVSSYLITNKLFSTRLLLPFALLLVSFNVGACIFPVILEKAYQQLGYRSTLLLCAGVTGVNATTGLIYMPALKSCCKKTGKFNIPSAEAPSREKDVRMENSSGSLDGAVYTVSNAERKENVPGQSLEIQTAKLVRGFQLKQSKVGKGYTTLIEEVTADDIECTKKQVHQVEEAATKPLTLRERLAMITKSHDYGYPNIIESMEDIQSLKSSLKSLLGNAKVYLYLAHKFLVFFSIVGFTSICTEYSTYKLKLRAEDLTYGIQAFGFSMLPAGFFYLVLIKYTRFCLELFSCFIYIICGVICFIFLLPLTPDQYFLAMGFFGFGFSIILYHIFLDSVGLAEKTYSVVLYLLENTARGLGGILAAFILTFLQVDVNASSGLIVCGCALILSALLHAPLSIMVFLSSKNALSKTELLGFSRK